LSPNLDQEKIDTWIYEAQINEMRTFLGGELYKLMIEDWDGTAFVDPLFVKLWEGDDTGDEFFFGLKQPIGLFSISNITKNNQFNVTRYSNSELDSEIEEQARETAATSSASAAYSRGIKLLEETEEYLIINESDYPTWIDPATVDSPTTFEYIRVPPNRKNLKNNTGFPFVN